MCVWAVVEVGQLSETAGKPGAHREEGPMGEGRASNLPQA